MIDEEIGKGLPLWLPNGTVLRDELEKLAQGARVQGRLSARRHAAPAPSGALLPDRAPALLRATHMYPAMEVRESTDEGGSIVRETYMLKPMNCPHHHRIFAARPRSYRELPLRLAEYGQVYRFEDAGALSGLLRVRGMCMNDAHIYCTEEQIEGGVPRRDGDAPAGLRDPRPVGLRHALLDVGSGRPEGQGEVRRRSRRRGSARSRSCARRWTRAGLPFEEGKGEAAFYGPKIDMQFRTVTGREETASTNQLDFAHARASRPRLRRARTARSTRPYIIHRAPLGTHERFVAFLIEHYGGAFPTWLAPVQVRVLTVADRFDEYGAASWPSCASTWCAPSSTEPRRDASTKKIRNAVTHEDPERARRRRARGRCGERDVTPPRRA